MAVITISDQTLQELDRVLNKSKFPAKSLRLCVQYGWSGESFSLALDEPTEKDVVEKAGNITFVVDSKLVKTYGGFQIDYIKRGFRRGFQISPTVMSAGTEGNCGSCGSCS